MPMMLYAAGTPIVGLAITGGARVGLNGQGVTVRDTSVTDNGGASVVLDGTMP